MTFPQTPEILRKRSLSAPFNGYELSPKLEVIYAWMLCSRILDNRILELFRQGLIKGTVTGGQGNESLIVPLALIADKTKDVISFTHRGLGGHLVWSGHVCDHLNQYFANANSPTKGREGNIHHGDPSNRSIPMISHLGAMSGTVLGLTDSQRRLGHEAVGFTFFGDGSSSTGDIHESLNLASLLSLPIVFVVENNKYAYSTPVSEQFVQGTELWKRASGYGMEGFSLDATDALTTATLLDQAINKVRTTLRPILIEAHTLRLRGHAAYDTCDYLQPGEAEGFNKQDGLLKLRLKLTSLISEEKVKALEDEIAAFIEACIKVSLPTARPSANDMEADLFAPVNKPIPWKPTLDNSNPTLAKETLNSAQAINKALKKILTERPESLLLGQDIGTYGGAFKVTDGLLKQFGRPRVFNTPLAESACTGYAIGLALGGHRPIEEFQFSDFVTEATTQITLNAATMHFRSGAKCPVVFRLPSGGGLTFGSFHSQELESFLLAMPGLKALYPSTPQDAFNALLAAYEDDNPVLLFEHKGLYRKGKGEVMWDPNYRSIWTPHLLRTGNYATFVTYGEMVNLAGEACAYFDEEYDKSCDLFDLRCLSPLNLEPIETSLKRTGRLIVLHEGRVTHGFGAELTARLVERNFKSLLAAPLRIGSLDLPVPFAPELESAYRPNTEKIIEKITQWLN